MALRSGNGCSCNISPGSRRRNGELCQRDCRDVRDFLRQFDDTIEHICYTKADDGSFRESIITRGGAIMRFPVYGDGIQKK